MRDIFKKFNKVWTTHVFYVQSAGITQKPPLYANIYWSVFTLIALVLVVCMWMGWFTHEIKSFATSLLFMFIVPEAIAVYYNRLGKKGLTYSEWVWYYNHSPMLRAIWGSLLSLFVAVYINPVLGIMLLIWLVSHFALRHRAGHNNKF